MAQRQPTPFICKTVRNGLIAVNRDFKNLYLQTIIPAILLADRDHDRTSIRF